MFENLYLMHSFSHEFLIALENVARTIPSEKHGISYPYCFLDMSIFLPTNSHHIECHITCGMKRFSHKIFKAREIASKLVS